MNDQYKSLLSMGEEEFAKLPGSYGKTMARIDRAILQRLDEFINDPLRPSRHMARTEFLPITLEEVYTK